MFWTFDFSGRFDFSTYSTVQNFSRLPGTFQERRFNFLDCSCFLTRFDFSTLGLFAVFPSVSACTRAQRLATTGWGSKPIHLKLQLANEENQELELSDDESSESAIANTGGCPTGWMHHQTLTTAPPLELGFAIACRWHLASILLSRPLKPTLSLHTLWLLLRSGHKSDWLIGNRVHCRENDAVVLSHKIDK